MPILLVIAVILIGVPAVGACLYLLSLTLLSASLPPAPRSTRRLRFDVIVAAHDEAAVLARVLASLARLDWPRERYRVLVVADNCTDVTAILARSLGADVLERHDEQKRGKGYALALAFQSSRERGFADAVVVVDADAEASPNLLEAIASRLERGAGAVQVRYGVSNVSASWRTRLLSIAKGCFHVVRSRARARLRLSCGIRGNGWAVTHRVLEAVPYAAFSLTEDLEYGIDLGLAGVPVQFADEASCNAEMVSRGPAAGTQRERWERGRFELIRSRTLPLLRTAVRRRDAVCLDLAMDLLVLPLSYVVLNVLLLTAITVGAMAVTPMAAAALAVSVFCWLSLASYVLRGWQLSGVGLIGLLDLARTPFFIAWKLLVMLRRPNALQWIRTKRENTP